MTWWLVVWVTYSCPGGLFGGLVPTSARPLVCAQITETAVVSSRRKAHRAVKKAGCSAAPSLYWCKGLKCYEKEIECPTVLRIEGEELK